MDQVSKWLGKLGVAAGSSTIAIADTWGDMFKSCLLDEFKSNRSFKCNSSQCNLIVDYLHQITASIRRFLNVVTVVTGLFSPDLIKYNQMEFELCRAILEAKLFLQDCSEADFWKNPNSISKLHTGEAYDVLLHDLIWSTAGFSLAVCKSFERRCPKSYIDARSGVLRRVEECTRELSSSRIRLHLDRADFYHSLQNPPRLYYDKSRKKHLTFLAQKSKAWQLFETTESGGGSAQHLNMFEIDAGDMGQRHFLGTGAHGDVYRSSWLGQTVAVKVFSRTSEEQFLNEVSLLAGLQNPFIVDMVGWCKKNSECMLVMELAQTDLGKVIKEISSGEKPALSLLAAVDIMLQISRGTEYLHRRRIMHRDIKPSNVLLEPSSVERFARQGRARVKLCDFGLAKVKQLTAEDRSQYTTLNMGTAYYRAPEVLQDDEADSESKYSRKADVFSFAITCSEILGGTSATACYHNLSRKAMREKMLANVRPNLTGDCPSLLCDLISRCWDTDQERRPPFCRISKALIYIKLNLMRDSSPFDKHELNRRLSAEEEEFEGGGSRAASLDGVLTNPFDEQVMWNAYYCAFGLPNPYGHSTLREEFRALSFLRPELQRQLREQASGLSQSTSADPALLLWISAGSAQSRWRKVVTAVVFLQRLRQQAAISQSTSDDLFHGMFVIHPDIPLVPHIQI